MKNVIDQGRVHWPIKCSTTRSMIKHFKMFKFMQYQYRLNEHTSKQDVLRLFQTSCDKSDFKWDVVNFPDKPTKSLTCWMKGVSYENFKTQYLHNGLESLLGLIFPF